MILLISQWLFIWLNSCCVSAGSASSSSPPVQRAPRDAWPRVPSLPPRPRPSVRARCCPCCGHASSSWGGCSSCCLGRRRYRQAVSLVSELAMATPWLTLAEVWFCPTKRYALQITAQLKQVTKYAPLKSSSYCQQGIVKTERKHCPLL